MQKAWRTFVNGKDGKPVIGQRPNLTISVWFICAIISHFITNHTISLVGHAALTFWAVMEVGWGASYFRRILGLVVLILTLSSWFW